MTSVDQVPAQRAVTSARIGRVTARMREIGEELPPQDGVAVFNRVYLSVTEELEQRLLLGHFEDRTATGELGTRFAARFLDAVDAEATGRRTPACWRPLFRFRRHPAVRPLQFALAGINAHIGHDLPLALVDTCRALDAGPDELEADFERIGELLTGLEEHIREDLMPGPDLLDVADPLTHLVGSWSLERARGGAWAAFRALWGLRGLGELLEETAEGLDATVGMTGRCLLTPL
ncbi:MULTISPECIES: DUF5995 family protein [unclassified Streptomyces]|uniref:DUF5995 family protein n=1 Tax=unclassified Streptomyces TaxID=2593676 RepID=UPI002DDB9784|nr:MULTISPECIES: DUF5995 family protein [unclassified Streptomyces]WSA96369.1 DUF5995 family protein [Streptomyces sp. NBC_01795]WSB80783.1 DUF5995 family protein [Streptomyces sp. NBC_01775]WSS39714.1 DUF5995 family protein [Streptomyces sp. NBC_01187]